MNTEKLFEAIEKEKDVLFSYLSEMIRIDSQNFGPHGNEKPMADYLLKVLSDLGITAESYSPLDVPGLTENIDYYPGRHLEERRNGLKSVNADKERVSREISRLDRSRIFGIMRAILLKIAVNLKNQDYIDDIYDVFYLFYDEITDKDPAGYRAIIADRKVEYDSYSGIPAFSRLIFKDKVTSKRLRRVTTHILNKDISKGIPVSAGKVTGEVLIIEKASAEFDTSGKIIVTKMTDPGWVFMIKNCMGVVAEKGSLLSHTAIVTRELGKPAIVNVKDATSIFKNGDIIELDADTGVIKVIKHAE